ncbi:hypothetical protein AX16_002162, partial [Volvariella volvacea WC 439]
NVSAIQTYNFNFAKKVHNVHGQKNNTRANAFMSTLKAEQRTIALLYNGTYKALLALGRPKEDNDLRPLEANQLWGADMNNLPKICETKRQE